MFFTTDFKLSNLGRDLPIKIGNNHIKRKYLGIHLDENLKWNEHADKLCSKVNRYLSDLFSNACEYNLYKSKLRNAECNVVLDHVPKTEYYNGSFSYRGGILWNSLPIDIKTSESKAIFKRKLANRQANC